MKHQCVTRADAKRRATEANQLQNDLLQIQRAVTQPTTGVAMTSSQHAYEVRPRTDDRGVNLISDALPFGALCITGRKQRRKLPPAAAPYSEHNQQTLGSPMQIAGVRRNLV